MILVMDSTIENRRKHRVFAVAHQTAPEPVTLVNKAPVVVIILLGVVRTQGEVEEVVDHCHRWKA